MQLTNSTMYMADDEMNQPAVASSGSNKWIYIVVGVVVVLAVLGFMGRMAGFMVMRAAGVNIQPGADGTATYSNSEGSVTVGGNKMPDNWPSDVPANFAGASIQYSGSSNPQTGRSGAAVVYTVTASASAVFEYYKAQLATQGWTIESTANMGAVSVLGAKKGDRTFGVSLTDAGNGSVQVSAGLDM